ncbi:MAG: hypothetical protein MJB57_09445 [Gemmatimonadetes bacterium]|nr:hypothetical protein [Gemmatimonadota bacterium]
MSDRKRAIKVISGSLELGYSLSEAVQRALGSTLTDFAARNDFRQEEVSMCLLGYPQRVYPRIRDALCSELHVSRAFLDEKIAEQAARRGDAMGLGSTS